MSTSVKPIPNGYMPSNNPFSCEPYFEDTHLRIKVICTHCEAIHIGNAEDVKAWQHDHRCARHR